MMTAKFALVALAVLSSRARCDDSAAPAPQISEIAPTRSSPGWARQGNSLVLYGADGGLFQEIPLKSPDAEGTSSRETLGGVSPDGKLAWTLDRRIIWSPGRTKLLESRRTFKTYGTTDQELWHDSDVDLPERGDAVAFARDGKTMLLARNDKSGWKVEVRDWMGRVLTAVGPFPQLISMALTPNGRFLLARWRVPDSSDTHTFLDLAKKNRRDVASSDLVLGLARIDDDGVVRSGSKTVFAFDLSASTSAPSGKP